MESATPVSADDRSKKSLEETMGPLPSHTGGTMIPIDNRQAIESHNLALVEEAITAIGFGKFQWQLTFSCGFGFLVDQMLLVSVSLVTPEAAKEFGPQYATLLSASLYAGLFLGSSIIGALADNIGRKLVWQMSIFAVSAVTMVAASSPNWAALNVFLAMVGFFGGGNLAIDLAILSESIPESWSLILPGLACIWGLGNVITGLLAWPLLLKFCCPAGSTPDTCTRSDNMGWRYLYITLGGLCLVMAFIRTLILGSRESPRWLVSCGRIHEAVDVLNWISRVNKSTYGVSEDNFIVPSEETARVRSPRENFRRFTSLFANARKTRLMICLALMWLLIGIAYPLYTVFLPYYLSARGAQLGDSTYTAYRDWVVSSTAGVFGPILAMYMVSTRWLRSRRSMLILAAMCAAFAGAYTSVRSEAENLAFSSMINFWLNGLYAVVYSYTPLAIDVESRGAATGSLMALGRLASLSAPFIATFADVTTSAPIWVACGAFVGIGLTAIVSPIDTTAFKEETRPSV